MRSEPAYIRLTHRRHGQLGVLLSCVPYRPPPLCRSGAQLHPTRLGTRDAGHDVASDVDLDKPFHIRGEAFAADEQKFTANNARMLRPYERPLTCMSLQYLCDVL